MESGKRSRWIIGFAVLLLLLAVLLTHVDSVQATLDGLHAVKVYLRVETEIMQKTPAGRYYEALYFKHLRDVNQILNAHPDHDEKLISALLMFVPELEALLDGDGNTAYISSDHVESLKAELDWFSSMGSPTLEEDIQRERERLSLDNFVGMTMSDAWDLINSSWTPDMVINEFPALMGPALTPTMKPYISPTPQLVVDQTFVPDTDRKWASYVSNEVYFEYPAAYYLRKWSVDKYSAYYDFVPSTGTFVFEQGDPDRVTINIWKDSTNMENKLKPDYWFPPESIAWETTIHNGEFSGIEFVSNFVPVHMMNLNTIQYSQKDQWLVHIQFEYIMRIPSASDDFDYFAMIDKHYHDFQHMSESIKIQH